MPSGSRISSSLLEAILSVTLSLDRVELVAKALAWVTAVDRKGRQVLGSKSNGPMRGAKELEGFTCSADTRATMRKQVIDIRMNVG